MTDVEYSFQVQWSQEDGEYMATCSAFPGLSAFGPTKDEALKEGRIALAGFIETYKAHGTPLPDPN